CKDCECGSHCVHSATASSGPYLVMLPALSVAFTTMMTFCPLRNGPRSAVKLVGVTKLPVSYVDVLRANVRPSSVEYSIQTPLASMTPDPLSATRQSTLIPPCSKGSCMARCVLILTSERLGGVSSRA